MNRYFFSAVSATFLSSAIVGLNLLSATEAPAPYPYPIVDPANVDPIVKQSPYGDKSVWSYSGKDNTPVPWTLFHPKDYGSSKITFSGEGVTPVGTVPAPGIHPRIFFSPQDLPAIRKRIKEDRGAHEAWLNILEYANAMKLTYDEKADYAQPDWSKGSFGIHGRVVDVHRLGGYDKRREDFYTMLVNGQLPAKTYPNTDAGHSVAGFFLPASAEAYRCLIENDAPAGQRLATAVVTAIKFEQQRRAAQDKPPKPGQPPNPSTPRFDCSNLGLVYDFDFNFMTPEQQKIVHDELVNVSSWADNYGTFNNAESSRSNWATFTYWTFDLMAIQGEPGFNDLKFLGLYRGWRNFFNYSFFESGAAYEGEGKLLFGMDAVVAYDRVVPQYGLELLSQHPRVRAHYAEFTALSVLPTQDKYAVFDILGAMGKGLCTPQDLVVAHYLYPHDATIDFVYRTMVGDDYHNLPSAINQAWNNAITSAVFATSFNPDNKPEKLNLPLTFFCGQRALLMTRSSWDQNATMLTMHVRGASGGHPYRDRNSIMLAAQGRTWITIPNKDIGGWACNTVLIDGGEQNSSTPGRVVDYVDSPNATFMTGDAKYCWDWVWGRASKNKQGTPCTKDDTLKGNIGSALGWEPLEQCFNDFAWTKSDREIYTRPLKINASWIAVDGAYEPVVRAVNSPVLRSFRSAGLVRGPHPYVLVVDDVQRDNFPAEYEWNLSLTDDVVPYLPKTPLGQPGDIILVGKASLDPQGNLMDGEPAFLVRVLNCLGKRKPVEIGPRNKWNILSMKTLAVYPDDKVLLYAFRKGDPLPTTSYTATDAINASATVSFPDQSDAIAFNVADSGKSNITISRGGSPIMDLSKPVTPMNDPASDRLTNSIRTIPAELKMLQIHQFDPVKQPGFLAEWNLSQANQGACPPLVGSDPAAQPIELPISATPVEGLNGQRAISTAKEPIKIASPFSKETRGGPFTLAFWIKTKVDPNMGNLFTVAGRCFSMSIVQGNIYYGGGGVPGGLTFSPTSMVSSWTHFVVTYDGTKLNVYRNGLPMFSSPTQGKVDLGDTLSLGGDNGYGDAGSQFQNLYVYNTDLTAQAARSLYIWDRYATAVY